METLKLGTVAGCHALPVEDFIFDGAIDNPTDVQAIRKVVEDKLSSLIQRGVFIDTPLNKYTNTDKVLVIQGATKLDLYVTGLTIVTTEVIRYCTLNGVNLTLYHFDSGKNRYFAEDIF